MQAKKIIHILNSRDKKHILNRLIMRSGRKRSLRMTDTESRICIMMKKRIAIDSMKTERSDYLR